MSAKIDITGQRFGRLVAMEPTAKRTNGSIVWQCRCDCGNIKDISCTALRNGQKSCDCVRIKNLTRQRFGKLVAIKLVSQRTNQGNTIWQCLCDCGGTVFVRANNLQSRCTKSCGCLGKESRIRNGRIRSKNITGRRFGRLIALRPTKKRAGVGIVWECRCDCGNTVFVSNGHLGDGGTRSCGCLRDATKWIRNTPINPMDVPFEITNIMKARRELKKAIKQAS